jgi:prepilin-type N-terminal cleavage/methylation domain-containing protein
MKHLGFFQGESRKRIEFWVMNKRESGFSLVELVIVVAISLIVTAMAAPSVRQVLDNYRLNASGHDVASVLQQARMAAVQANQPYYVQFNVGAPPNTVVAIPANRFNPPTVAPGDPTAVTAGNVAFQAVPPGNTATLDAFVGPAPQVGGVIGFSARGIPCVQGASPWVCTAGVGFEWFMQSSSTGSWEAITVTPAGRIKSWRFAGQTWQ